MPTKRQKRFYYPELDGLRFFAFLMVFIHNSPEFPLGQVWQLVHEFGWIGVDVFFGMSGFLITKLLVSEFRQDGQINIKQFYLRRILRIWPLYFIYIIFASLYILETSGWTIVTLKHIGGLATFTYNFVYLFLTYKIYIVFVHLWIISYEQQFYFAIPWVLSRVMEKQEKSNWLLLLTIVVVGSGIRACFIYLNTKHPIIYMLPFTHFEAILGGIGLGLGLFEKILKQITQYLLVILGLICIMLVGILPNNNVIGWKLMLTYPLIGISVTVFLYILTDAARSFQLKFLRNRLFLYLGKISYGLYMFQFFGLLAADALCHKIFGTLAKESINYAVLVTILGLIISFLLSTLSYHWVEKPFLKLKEKNASIITRPI
jgi:peptidoglycan/LPS O-acetylase OafA/YrhL